MLHFFKNIFQSRSANNSVKGFSLIELLVSIAIVSVLVTIIFFNQSKYSERALLYNLADDVALEIAIAQSYSTSVRETTPGSGDFDTNYGVTFSLNQSPNGSPTSYIVFADYDGNGIYSGNWASCVGECLRKNEILHGNYIEILCLQRLNNLNNLNHILLCNTTIRRIDILFVRPNLQPETKFLTSAGTEVTVGAANTGSIVRFSSPNGLLNSVVTTFSGNVLVR